MAFITVGMGGGTGTGGAPIISKICRDLGILTVGIVTTPFSYEGRKRQLQAEEGIKMLKQYVDTLLVISNDKLRHQFGNLKMKEAFAKADNVLATAAKCITDVINSTGQINVDFADVCTVMRNGGVAILGSAAVEGETRAQQAIEEALNSPLLNDNDIRGAKWILININSSEGDHEFTMDEVEIIQSYLLSQTGDDSDIILGLGYDNTLGAKIGITLIATGFEFKDPFPRREAKSIAPKKDEKITMTLSMPGEQLKMEQKPVPASETQKKEEQAAADLPQELQPHLVLEETGPYVLSTMEEPGKTTVENKLEKSGAEDKSEWILSQGAASLVQDNTTSKITETNSPSSAVSGGYLARPSNIYAEESKSEKESIHSPHPVKNLVLNAVPPNPAKEEESSSDMQLVFRDAVPAADVPRAHPTQHSIPTPSAEEPATQDEAEEQRRRASERINKLRNLSFNINASDPNNEFETVPAYIRRNLELYNTISSVEDFYSNYEVRTDENNQGEISTINTFLDGKKPD